MTNLHHFLSIFLILSLPKGNIVTSEFVGGFIFPHGGITLDPENRDFSNEPANKANSKEESIKMHNAMKKCAEKLIRTEPELIILSTPHGFTTVDNFLILGNTKAYGNSGPPENVNVEIEFDVPMCYKLFYKLKNRNKVEILNLGASTQQMELLWAEIIPLWFIINAAKNANYTLPKFIIIGQPISANYANRAKILKLGKDLFSFVNSGDLEHKRIAIAISGDLSHYHSRDPTSPYEYHPNANLFDYYVEDWAQMDINLKSVRESNQVLEKAGKISETIGSCGYSGLVLLQGILKQSLVAQGNLKSHFFYYSAPTYFGMIACGWIPEKLGDRRSLKLRV